jgi:hypothetical protein
MILTSRWCCALTSIAWLSTCWASPLTAAEGSPCEQQLAAAAAQGQYTYLLLHRQDDAATQAMRTAIAAHVEQSAGKTALVPVNIADAAEARLVARFDATRTPMPCVMCLAPNGAVTGVYPLQVSGEQLQRAILTPKYSEMVKTLQEQKLVVVCLQPRNGGTVPPGVAEFEALPAFKNYTRRITVQADDAAEAGFYTRMKVSPDITATNVIVFAPPGVFVGKFDDKVRGTAIAQAFHASGRCNCQECQQHRR